eukprot:g2116.t1
MLRTITKNKKHTFAKACIDLCRGVKRSLVTVAEVGQDNAVALVKLDDGKMNAFSFDMISAIDSAMEDCRDAGAIIISGNEKCLSAGFDLSVMGKGPSPEAGDMLRKGCELAIKIAEFPRPTIFAAGGHAMALGAIMLFTGDLRIGVSDNAKAKIGLNEVHIGMPLPIVGMELARWRLSPNHLTRATTLGNIYSPSEAILAGYLDECVPSAEIEQYAIKSAEAYSKIKTLPFVTTKKNERRDVLKACRDGLETDVKMFS